MLAAHRAPMPRYWPDDDIVRTEVFISKETDQNESIVVIGRRKGHDCERDQSNQRIHFTIKARFLA